MQGDIFGEKQWGIIIKIEENLIAPQKLGDNPPVSPLQILYHPALMGVQTRQSIMLRW